MRLLRKALAIEEHSDGESFQEIEYVFYGKIADMSVLDNAISKEHQEQHEIIIDKTDDNKAEGRMRIRKTIPDIIGIDRTDYVLTTKIKSEHGNTSTPIPATLDAFEQFKLLAKSGMKKDRYNFAVEGSDLVFEVDLFYLVNKEVGSKQYSPYVKIDLEITNKDIAIPPMPFEMENLITNQRGQQTKEESEFIEKLYREVFRNC